MLARLSDGAKNQSAAFDVHTCKMLRDFVWVDYETMHKTLAHLALEGFFARYTCILHSSSCQYCPRR